MWRRDEQRGEHSSAVDFLTWTVMREDVSGLFICLSFSN